MVRTENEKSLIKQLEDVKNDEAKGLKKINRLQKRIKAYENMRKYERALKIPAHKT